MARFRGTVQTGGGQVSRLGHKTTGLVVRAIADTGYVDVRLYVDKNDVDHVNIGLVDAQGVWHCFYVGPIDHVRYPHTGEVISLLDPDAPLVR